MFKKKKTPVQEPLSAKEYEKLGRSLSAIYDANYANKGRLLWMSFLKGISVGLGTVIGATIVVGAVLWILSLFDSVPFIDRVINSIDSSVEVNRSIR